MSIYIFFWQINKLKLKDKKRALKNQQSSSANDFWFTQESHNLSGFDRNLLQVEKVNVSQLRIRTCW